MDETAKIVMEEAENLYPDETADSQLTYFGHYLMKYLREDRPEIYKELLDEGALQSFCQSREDRAETTVRQLMANGANWIEAEEIVFQDLLSLDYEI